MAQFWCTSRFQERSDSLGILIGRTDFDQKPVVQVPQMVEPLQNLPPSFGIVQEFDVALSSFGNDKCVDKRNFVIHQAVRLRGVMRRAPGGGWWSTARRTVAFIV